MSGSMKVRACKHCNLVKHEIMLVSYRNFSKINSRCDTVIIVWLFLIIYVHIYIFIRSTTNMFKEWNTLLVSTCHIIFGKIAFSHQIERKWNRSGILAITRPKSVRKSCNRTDRKMDICVIVARWNWCSWSIVRSTQDPSMWIPVISIHVLNSSFYTVLYYYVFWVFWEDTAIFLYCNVQCAMRSHDTIQHNFFDGVNTYNFNK